MLDLRHFAASVLAAALAATAMGGGAHAQERTTATYEDWVLQCQMSAGPPPQKLCDITQTAQSQGHTVSLIAIAHPVKDAPVKLVVQVPINISPRAGVRIQTSDADPGLTAPFDHCLPAGCFAEFELRDDTIKSFRSATGPGKLTFMNAGGQPVAIPVSFKGFGEAFDALGKE
jgi:invasion protein IalB